MWRSTLFGMVLCVLGSACSGGPGTSTGTSPAAPSADSTEKELEKLQGVWICVEEEAEGRQKKNAEDFQNRLTISGKEMTEEIKAIKQTFRGTIELDVSREPKRIIFHISQPIKEQAKKVYEVSGDTLRVASFVLDQRDFPPEVSGKGENRQVEIYKRKK